MGCAQGVVVIALPVMSGRCKLYPHGASEGMQTVAVP